MHPALFLLNSCILYVEQIIQKKGGDHSISVMFQSIRNRECMRYNPNMDYMETDHDKYIHYEINFEEKDWKALKELIK